MCEEAEASCAERRDADGRKGVATRDRQTEEETDRQADRQKKETDIPTDRQTDRQTA